MQDFLNVLGNVVSQGIVILMILTFVFFIGVVVLEDFFIKKGWFRRWFHPSFWKELMNEDSSVGASMPDKFRD